MAAVAEIQQFGHTIVESARNQFWGLKDRGGFAIRKADLVFDRDRIPNEHFLHGEVKAAIGFMNPHIKKHDTWRTVNGEIMNPLAHITGLSLDELRGFLHETHDVGVLRYEGVKMGDRKNPVVGFATFPDSLRGFTVLAITANEYRKRRWYDKDGGICWKKVVGDAEQAARGIHDVALAPHKNLDVMIEALREGNQRHQEAYMRSLKS